MVLALEALSLAPFPSNLAHLRTCIHQALLSELRRLRDSDAQVLRDKRPEILKEVQRLAGEIEVLRGVVEEDLKRCRSVREIHTQNSAPGLAISHDLEEQDDDHGC